MTAEEWIESEESVSRRTAEKWITDHDAYMFEFEAEHGRLDEYLARDVLIRK